MTSWPCSPTIAGPTEALDAGRWLTEEQYAEEPVPGWSSVRSIFSHIALATEVNLCDLWMATSGEAQASRTQADLPTLDDAARLLGRADHRFEGLRPVLTPEWLDTLLTLHAIGRTFTLPRWAILRHVVNHSTYHRGQVASKLKRFGVEQSTTDFFWWAIEQIPQEA